MADCVRSLAMAIVTPSSGAAPLSVTVPAIVAGQSLAKSQRCVCSETEATATGRMVIARLLLSPPSAAGIDAVIVAKVCVVAVRVMSSKVTVGGIDSFVRAGITIELGSETRPLLAVNEIGVSEFLGRFKATVITSRAPPMISVTDAEKV